jgi:hypothetical protein
MTSTLSDMAIFAGLAAAECAEFERRMRRLDYVRSPPSSEKAVPATLRR